MTSAKMVKDILDGTAVLFVGAGVSFLAKDTKQRELPSGLELRNELLAETGTESPFPLDKVSTYYVKKFGSAQLYDYLVERLTVTDVNRELAEFYKLPWRRIYTTNYDGAIEMARKPSRSTRSFILSDSARENPDGAIIHINGYIEKITPQSVVDELQLTDYSYATSNFSSNLEWSQLFRNDLRLARSILFVGYSLADLDVARMLVSESALKEKTYFFISPTASEIEIASLEPFGEVSTGGVEELFSLVVAGKKVHEKSRVSDVYYSITDLSAVGAPSDNSAAIKIHEQLVYGAVALPELMTAACVFGNVPYNIPRIDVQGEIKKN